MTRTFDFKIRDHFAIFLEVFECVRRTKGLSLLKVTLEIVRKNELLHMCVLTSQMGQISTQEAPKS